jgi:hypothetical protein
VTLHGGMGIWMNDVACGSISRGTEEGDLMPELKVNGQKVGEGISENSSLRNCVPWLKRKFQRSAMRVFLT